MAEEKIRKNSLEIIELVGKDEVELHEGETLLAVLVTQEGKIILAGKAAPEILSGVGNYLIERGVIQRLKATL